MHCYRCGRRVADRSPRCDNCGQKFNYGDPGSPKRAQEPEPAPAGPPIVPAPPPKTGLRDSIFEVSQTSGRDPTTQGSGPSSNSGPDPTVPARMALSDATDQAVIALGDGTRNPIETSADGPAPGVPIATALSQAPPRLQPPPFAAESDRETGNFSVGKVLSGRLEIVADLGGGPLGRVFKAIDRKKGSVVVVKAIPASKLPPAALQGRFAEVIQLVKGLTHPNLVRVHGAGREGDTAFVIMQHLEGLPLRRLLDVKRENGGTFTFEEAEPIVVQICQGLQFAHASLVHGGLKPENVFVQVDSLKLIDTGFSRLFSPAEWREIQRESRDGENAARRNAGAYLAPEFAFDGKIDRRADVYSVGAILYEMLTGRAPTGPDSPPVSSLNPSVPRAVDRVVQKAMAAAPEARYATASELKDAVMRVLGGDILADDLESGDMLGGTFVDPTDKPEDAPIEIEYVEAPPDPEPERKSDDATPVGAIELQEPLWEPDEIAETRASDPSARRQPRTEALPRPGMQPPVAIAARGISKPAPEDRTATSAIARPEISIENLVDTAKGGPAAREADRPSGAERTSLSSVPGDDPVDQSIDLGGDEAAGTQAGFEPTTGGEGRFAPEASDSRKGSWLDQEPEGKAKREPVPDDGDALEETDPEARLAPRTLAPVTARPRSGEARAARSRASDLELSEGSPLDLELDDPDAPPSARPPIPPGGDAPTIRRPPLPLQPPNASGSQPRRPSATPPPWDGSSRNDQPTSQLASPADRPGDRPTDPAPHRPLAASEQAEREGGRKSDRPTVPRPRYEDNPTARALSPPNPPPLELTFSQLEEGNEGAPPVDRLPERPTADAPAPMVRPAVAPVPRPMGDRPTLTGGGQGRAFVARRPPSRLPTVMVFLVFAAATAGGGGWAYSNRDKIAALIAPNPPAALVCPSGMIPFEEGAFMQGSNKLDPDRDITEMLSREVVVKSYCIDRYEFPNEPGTPPFTNMTFAEAAAACEEKGKRLCTEPEWERACKGPLGSRYPYGDKFEAGICNVGSQDQPGKPAKSGAHDKCGLKDGPQDLSGNVWEMTASPWPDDPEMRVIKGGSARLPAWGARCAYRDSIEIQSTADDIGFRCCK